MTENKNILLIGGAGNGKSTLANVLTNTNKFKEISRTIGTQNNQIEEFTENGTNYHVIDTVGIGDIMHTDQEVWQKLLLVLENIKELNQIFWVTRGRIAKKEEEIIQQLLATFGADIVNYLTMVRTDFPEFEDNDVCEEKKKFFKEEYADLAYILSEVNIIYVDNPPLKGRNVKWNKEARVESRKKLLNYLANHQGNYQINLKKTLAEWLIANQITQNEFNNLDDLFTNKEQKFTQEEIINLLKEQKERKLQEEKIRKKICEEREKKDQNQWFTPQKWLTDREIDWALEQLQLNSSNKHFAILPSWQAITTFAESHNESDPQIFTEFYQQLNQENKEIIIIPVNKYQLHWSLLVYEVKKKIFHHYDTLSGLNWNYIRPLCQQILTNSEIEEKEQSRHLITHHNFNQGNGYDCGVGVIALAERLINKQELFSDLNLGQERKKWRKKVKKLVNGEKKMKEPKQPPVGTNQEKTAKSNSFFSQLGNFNGWWLLLIALVLVVLLIVRKIKNIF